MHVMCATQHMAELCIPFILAKIKETSEAKSSLAKSEALNYLRHFAGRFNGEILEKYATQVWEILKNELFNNFDESLRASAVNTAAKYLRGLREFDRNASGMERCERATE